MPQAEPVSFSWRPLAGMVLFVLAVLLMLSWTQAGGRAWWDSVDLAAFAMLNGSLDADANRPWNFFWALSNVRWSDLAMGAMMALILVIPGAVFPRGQIIRGFVAFVLLLLLMLLIREGMDQFVDWKALNRPGPTLIVEDSVRLSALYPELGAKDHSARSFPGDHASVLFLWMGFCLAMRRNAWSVLIVFLTAAFQLPRLIGGAHWLSDNLVGGLSIALLGLAVGLCTPVLDHPLDGLDRLLSGLWDRCGSFLARVVKGS